GFFKAPATRPSAEAKNNAASASPPPIIAMPPRMSDTAPNIAAMPARGLSLARPGHADRIEAAAPKIAPSASKGIAAKDAIRPVANAAISAAAESQDGAPWRNEDAKASATQATLAASSITLKARPGAGTGSAAAGAASITAAKRRWTRLRARNSRAIRQLQMVTARRTAAARDSMENESNEKTMRSDYAPRMAFFE